MRGVTEPLDCFNCTDVNSSLARMQLIHTAVLSLTQLPAQHNATDSAVVIMIPGRGEGVPSLLLGSARGVPSDTLVFQS